MAANGKQLAVYARFLNSSRRSAGIYSKLSRLESDADRAKLFLQLRDRELEHAAQWANLIGRASSDVLPSRLGLASIMLSIAVKIAGTPFIAKFLIRGHERNLYEISQLPDPQLMAEDAREQARSLNRLAYPGVESSEDHHERGFLTGEGGTLRAAVLGINDGLVSNFSLVMGVAGGTGDTKFIVLAGIAGLLAGAFSMAAGEYISMRSQKDVYENIVRLEKAELTLWPERERAELVGFYKEKGLSEQEAQMVANHLSATPELALDTHLREEFGLDQDDLGSPWGAAFASMVAFAIGAIVPVAPFLVLGSGLAFVLSATLSALALVVVGGSLAWISGVNTLWGSARMLLVGIAAAAVTYGVGTAIGQTIN